MVLNVSGNRLDSIEDLQCLSELVTFIASDNEITNMKVSLADMIHIHLTFYLLRNCLLS